MELSGQRITYNIKEQLSNWVAPFLSQPQGYPKPTIMKLLHIENLLHQHFVTQKPIWVTFEYYNQDEEIQEETSLVYVESTVTADRSITLRDAYSEEAFSIDTEQILFVRRTSTYA